MHNPFGFRTGWPTGGTSYATVENAATYYGNLLGDLAANDGAAWEVAYGLTPGRVWLFELFDEKDKPNGSMEPHFGLLTETGGVEIDQ